MISGVWPRGRLSTRTASSRQTEGFPVRSGRLIRPNQERKPGDITNDRHYGTWRRLKDMRKITTYGRKDFFSCTIQRSDRKVAHKVAHGNGLSVRGNGRLVHNILCDVVKCQGVSCVCGSVVCYVVGRLFAMLGGGVCGWRFFLRWLFVFECESVRTLSSP